MKPLSPLPLGALAAGFGLAGNAFAQTAAPAAPTEETVMPVVRAKARSEPTDKQTLQATTTRIGKGLQELRDVPQSVTVVTERLMDDRNLDTLKEALKNTAGISFQAAEGGEEDIRLRGFSLQSTGDIFVDGLRDPAFYERDSFNWDRLEVIRGSASMLFGRGSTGGAANQVSKLPRLLTEHEVSVTLGTGGTLRGTADLNFVTGENAALRVTAMSTQGGEGGQKQDKTGFAPSFRWGIGTRDEFLVSLYHLDNHNGVNYGLPWLQQQLLAVAPDTYYGLASDYSASAVALGTFSHTHRFDAKNELRTTLRLGDYDRDLRASAIRFAAAARQPGGVAVTQQNFSADTVLTRGTNLKAQRMKTAYLQSDFSGKFQAAGLQHQVQAGVDAAHEDFANDAFSLPAGVTLTKPTTTAGAPDDGATVDEALRTRSANRTFKADGLGLYVQDLVQVAEHWKLLGGLRVDQFRGRYHAITAQGAATTTVNGVTTANPCFTPADTRFQRSDSLWSHRLGLLYQPSATSSYHLSYGTSFNTSGDAYQYDPGTADTPAEKSRNLELGAKLDSADGRFSTRLALFHSTKYNERNRDSESVDACNYVLSGQRHAAGLEMDFAGKLSADWELYASYAFIPVARVDASSGAAGTEAVGSRPGLTPKHTGTLWTTYRVSPRWRLGGGLNAASSSLPVAAAAGLVAPKWVTADLMAEYTLGPLSYKFNLSNLANKHYADLIYRGHYVPGKPRTLQMTVAYKF
ncbi:TonB-dependent siderophore receptor [Burkholderiales bacterium JOSHI_001]|nr:TonB-dependent siderophore receptor [Burkholderiales bacterium JOSHI_001]